MESVLYSDDVQIVIDHAKEIVLHIIYSSIPPLDSLPIPTVTSPSNIASIPANSLVKSDIPVPITTYDVVIGFMVSQVG